MKTIKEIPCALEFESKGVKKDTLIIDRIEDFLCFSFDITTDILYRMGNGNDNSVRLWLDGRWETFTSTLRTTLKDATFSFKIIENNNKRSRYIIEVRLNNWQLPLEIDAKAEDLSLI